MSDEQVRHLLDLLLFGRSWMGRVTRELERMIPWVDPLDQPHRCCTAGRRLQRPGRMVTDHDFVMGFEREADSREMVSALKERPAGLGFGSVKAKAEWPSVRP